MEEIKHLTTFYNTVVLILHKTAETPEYEIIQQNVEILNSEMGKKVEEETKIENEIKIQFGYDEEGKIKLNTEWKDKKGIFTIKPEYDLNKEFLKLTEEEKETIIKQQKTYPIKYRITKTDIDATQKIKNIIQISVQEYNEKYGW